MEECARAVNDFRNIVGSGKFILIVILPDEAAAILHAVKFWGDVKHGRLLVFGAGFN